MQLDFLIPRVERLRADGTFEGVHAGGAVGRLRRPVVLLARPLCTFALFEAAALPRARRRQAARIQARVASPYVSGGAVLVKSNADFGIWWWDLERIGPAIDARYGAQKPALRPETLSQPKGTGWRIVPLQVGYEAQLWRAQHLVASSWRRDRFTAATWGAFVRLQRGGASGPETPPPPTPLPIAFDSEAFAWSPSEITQGQAIGVGAATFAMGICSLVLFFLGQGLQLRAETRAMALETAEIRLATPQAGAVRALEANRQALAAYRQVEEQTNPIGAAGAAIGIVAFYDLTPTAVEVGEGLLTLTLPYAAVKLSDDLVRDFEDSGFFYETQPRTDSANQTLILEMKVREAAPPLTSSE